MNAEGVSKGAALKTLSSLLGISVEENMAIRDADNDNNGVGAAIRYYFDF